MGGLVRYHVLFVIRLTSRKVHIAGIVPEPNGEWMKQVGRNLTDCVDGFLCDCHYLIHDRSSLFTKEFLAILKSGGVKSVRLPARSPNLNAFADVGRGKASADKGMLRYGDRIPSLEKGRAHCQPDDVPQILRGK